MRIPALAILIATFAGCSALPDLDSRISPRAKAAPYPDLVPLDPVIAGLNASQTDSIEVEAALEGRVTRLRARATALRGSVFEGDERQRLEAGLH